MRSAIRGARPARPPRATLRRGRFGKFGVTLLDDFLKLSEFFRLLFQVIAQCLFGLPGFQQRGQGAGRTLQIGVPLCLVTLGLLSAPGRVALFAFFECVAWPLAGPGCAYCDSDMKNLDAGSLPSPCFVIDETSIERNLRIIDRVQQETPAKVLLALKGFAAWSMFPLIRRYLAGVTCSGLHEAMLGHEHFRKECHVYAPAFTDGEVGQVFDIADHVTFNSFSQWARFRDRLAGHDDPPSCGLRINPQHREVATAIYDPCAPKSRLGINLEQFERGVADVGLDGIDGLHFHTLCELNSDALERTLAVVEQKFSKYFDRLTWINFGGGHHISRPDYDVDRLIRLINDFRGRYPLQIYLEPGEAIALNTGVLVTTVLDIVHNEVDIAILDTSATAHMPDVLEMPYRPVITGAANPGDKPHTYRLGGQTCLAGDVIGDWSFDEPLQVGDKVIFEDMAHYTMVKTTTFNGIKLPAIAIHNSDSGETRVVREFGYEEYERRLS